MQTSRRRPRLPRSTPSRVCARPMVARDPPPIAKGFAFAEVFIWSQGLRLRTDRHPFFCFGHRASTIPFPPSHKTINFNKNRNIVMADLLVDMDYAIMTINSQIVYKPTSQRDDPEPDNDREVYVGNLPQHYTIEKFVNFAKKCGAIYSVRLLKGSGGLNKGFGYIMYRSLAAVDIAIDTYNGTFLTESDTNKPLIVQKSLRNTIMMIYGLSRGNNNKYYIRTEINYFVINHPSLLLKFECEDDSKLFISFKSLKAAQIFKKKLKDTFNMYGAKMYYFNDTENWERWEDLKKNISINPHGNRVRFVPIIPNNSNQRINVFPPTSSKSLLFKPFKPNHINDCPSKENVNLAQHKNNDKKYNNFAPVTHMETPLQPSRFNVNNPVNNKKFVGLQFSQKQQEVKQLNTSNSVVENCNMNELENSLPRLPLHTVWTNDNSSKDFGCTLPTKMHTLKKPFSSNLNYLPITKQNTNYMLNSKFQKQSQVIPNLMSKINSSRYFKSSYPLSASLEQKLHPIAENMNTSFFTLDNENPFPVTGQNINTLEQYSGCINQPLNMDNIWKDYQCQPPRM